jgi:hypothetical protein
MNPTVLRALGITDTSGISGNLIVHNPDLEIWRVELPLTVGLSSHWDFLVFSDSETSSLDPGQIEMIEDMRRKFEPNQWNTSEVPLVIVASNLDRQPRANPFPPPTNVFYLNARDLNVTPTACFNPRYSPFLDAAKRQLGAIRAPERLSPYAPNRPVHGWKFFGRHKELERIAFSNENIAVIGPRRIGKTSLLLAADEKLRALGCISHYINVQDCVTETEVVHRIFQAASIRDFSAVIRRQGHLHDSTLHLLLKRLTRAGKVVLLIDELGNIAQRDTSSEWRLFGALRSFAQAGRLRVVVSAFQRSFLDRLADIDNPLYNFMTVMPVGGFSPEEIEKSVLPPLLLWGRTSNLNGLVTFITDNVGNQPHLLQYFCSAVFKKLAQNSSIDIMSIASTIVDNEFVQCFSEGVEDLFYSIPSPLLKYLYLRACWRAERNEETFGGIILDDDWLRLELKSLKLGSTLAVRRSIFEALEMRCLTEAVIPHRDKQRIAAPLIYRVIRSAEMSVEMYIEKLRLEASHDASYWGLEST